MDTQICIISRVSGVWFFGGYHLIHLRIISIQFGNFWRRSNLGFLGRISGTWADRGNHPGRLIQPARLVLLYLAGLPDGQAALRAGQAATVYVCLIILRFMWTEQRGCRSDYKQKQSRSRADAVPRHPIVWALCGFGLRSTQEKRSMVRNVYLLASLVVISKPNQFCHALRL